MAIAMTWAEYELPLIYCEFEGTWNWNDFHRSAIEGIQMIQSVQPNVNVIVNGLRSLGMPPGSPFPHLGKMLRHLPPNVGLLIIVTERAFTQKAMAIMAKMYDMQEQICTVNTLDEAERIIDSIYHEARIKEQLIQALRGGQSLALRAIEELRLRDWLHDGSLAGAHLADVDLHGAALFMAELSGVVFDMTDLRGANLFMANLYEARMRRTILLGASLIEADLQHADLRLADLRDANLHGANLTGANLEWVQFNARTVLPNGTTWHEGTDLSVFCDIAHPENWYTDSQTERETLPSRPVGFDMMLRQLSEDE